MSDDIKEICLGLGLIAIGFLIGALLVGSVILESMKNEAVERGKAEYYIDGSNEKKWRWKE